MLITLLICNEITIRHNYNRNEVFFSYSETRKAALRHNHRFVFLICWKWHQNWMEWERFYIIMLDTVNAFHLRKFWAWRWRCRCWFHVWASHSILWLLFFLVFSLHFIRRKRKQQRSLEQRRLFSCSESFHIIPPDSTPHPLKCKWISRQMDQVKRWSLILSNSFDSFDLVFVLNSRRRLSIHVSCYIIQFKNFTS